MSKKKCPEFENHERWLVSYADMLTLLFAVFVTLYALNLSDEQQPPSEQAAGSMQESFSTPLEDIPQARRIGPTEQGFGIFEKMQGNTEKEETRLSVPGSAELVALIAEDIDDVKTQLLKERLYGPEKFHGSDKAGEERIVDISRTDRGFKIQILARYFYAPGSIKVQKKALLHFDKIVGTIKDLGRDITIQGHTDSIPPAGSMTNWELSALRATHLVRYFINKHNFPATRLSAIGYADTKPIAHNGTKSGRNLNRRIEIHVNYDENFDTDPG